MALVDSPLLACAEDCGRPTSSSHFGMAQSPPLVIIIGMATHRHRTFGYSAAGLILIWLLVWGGYTYFRGAKVTPERVIAYLQENDLAGLEGEDRARALRRVADMMNQLGMEDRRRARWEGDWRRWFGGMTEEEKGAFIEATMPTGFKQMLESFEQLPPEKRRKAVEDSLRRLQRARESMEQQGGMPSEPGETNNPPLSPELREKIVGIGLKSFYSESSAETKAELAPMLEEMQRLMERGVLLRGGEGRGGPP